MKLIVQCSFAIVFLFRARVRPMMDQNVGETETILKMKKSLNRYPQKEAKIPQYIMLIHRFFSRFILRGNHARNVITIERYAARPTNP